MATEQDIFNFAVSQNPNLKDKPFRNVVDFAYSVNPNLKSKVTEQPIQQQPLAMGQGKATSIGPMSFGQQLKSGLEQTLGFERGTELPQLKEDIKGLRGPATIAASVAASAYAPGIATPSLARMFGPTAARIATSAATQAGAVGGTSALMGGQEPMDEAKWSAVIDASLGAGGKVISKTAQMASPSIKQALGGLTQLVTMGKTKYNNVRLWFKNGDEIADIVARGGKQAEAKIAKTADEMYESIDVLDKETQDKFLKLQNKADNYRSMVGKKVGKADEELAKVAIKETADTSTMGRKALDMIKEKSSTEELLNAYKDQIDEVNSFISTWNTGPKSVTELIGAKRALDTRLKNFYASKSQGLSQGSADLVESAYSSLRADIDDALKAISEKVGMKSYAKTYKQASDYYKYYGTELESLIGTKNLSGKTVVEKVNNLAQYIDGKPGGWAAFEETMANAPLPIRKDLVGMMNMLAARRAVQAAAGSPSGLLMTAVRGIALSPKNAFRMTRLTDRLLKTMKEEERGVISKMLTPGFVGYNSPEEIGAAYKRGEIKDRSTAAKMLFDLFGIEDK